MIETINTHDEYLNTKGWLQSYLMELHSKKNIWNKEKILEIYNLIIKEGWLRDCYKVNFILSFLENDNRFKGMNINRILTSFNTFGESLYRKKVSMERKKKKEKLKILKEQENCSNLEDFM